MIQGVIVLVVILVVLAFLVVGPAGGLSKRSPREDDQVREAVDEGRVESLAYTVPEGQDPVVLLVALRDAGLRVSQDPGSTTQRILIEDRDATTRERAREAIRGVGTAVDHGARTEAEVRFEDEGSDRPHRSSAAGPEDPERARRAHGSDPNAV